MKDAVIRIQAQDGVWEHIGGDRSSGIVAERLQMSANSYGPDTATFELHRDPAAAWPDLAAFTPVEIEVGNQVCWTGRISATQVQDGRERSLSVTCEGSQAVLDDDQYARTYVHRKLSEWRPLSDYATLTGDWQGHGGQVNTGGAKVFMGWPEGSKPQKNQLIGLVLDTGGSGLTTGYSMYARATRMLEVGRRTLATGQTGYLTTFGTSSTGSIITSATATIPAWNSATAYTTNTIVERNGNVYYALRGSTNVDPATHLDPWMDRTTYSVNKIVWYGSDFYQCNTGVTFSDSLTSPDKSANWTPYSGYWRVFTPPISYKVFTSSSVAGLQTLANLAGSSSTITDATNIYGLGNGRNITTRDRLVSAYTGSPTTSAYQSTGYFDVQGSSTLAPERFIVIVAKMENYAITALTTPYGLNFEKIVVYGKDSYSNYSFANRFVNGTQSEYDSAQTPVITAADVISDAVTAGGSDLTASVPTSPSLQLQHVVTDGLKTPREIVDQVNAYHGWITRVDENKQLVFKSRPTVPTVQLGKWSGYDFTNQAVSSGQDVYSRVIVEGQSESGGALRVARTAAQLASAVQISSSGSSTVTAAQQAGIKIVDRATSIKFNPTNLSIKSNATTYSTVSAFSIYRAGVTYVLTGTFSFDQTTTLSYPQSLVITCGRDGYTTVNARSTTNGQALTVSSSSNTATMQGSSNDLGPFAFTILWTPDTDQDFTSGYAFTFQNLNVSTGVGGDTTPSIRVGKADTSSAKATDPAIATRSATLAELRGIRRTYNLQVPGVQTTATLAAIGDAWLFDHFRAQFRGTVAITGPQALRQFTTGDPVHPSRLLLQAGELIQLTDRIDPDTGQLGRDARIAAVQYTHDDETCSIELDNRRDNLQTFLNRLAANS